MHSWSATAATTAAHALLCTLACQRLHGREGAPKPLSSSREVALPAPDWSACARQHMTAVEWTLPDVPCVRGGEVPHMFGWIPRTSGLLLQLCGVGCHRAAGTCHLTLQPVCADAGVCLRLSWTRAGCCTQPRSSSHCHQHLSTWHACSSRWRGMELCVLACCIGPPAGDPRGGGGHC